MPSKLKAGGIFPYQLKEERGEPDAPVFQLRVLSCLEEAELKASQTRYFNRGESDESESAMLAEMIAVALASHPLDCGDVREQLTSRECFELIAGAITGTMLTEDERKKFVLPALSAAELLAVDAA